jgi:hypothetical protein
VNISLALLLILLIASGIVYVYGRLRQERDGYSKAINKIRRKSVR